ncbi:MAG: endolytic transglycosylase MltG, partial [Sedimentisphaerales bacterium]|nr:endolytic transglycosylase MltG [Sedimentisphaerales bacterium]
MKMILRLVALLIVVVVGGVVTLGWAVFDTALRAPAADAQTVAFEVAVGEGVNQISLNLKEAGLIRSKFLFETYVWAIRSEGKIQAGVHQLQPGMSLVALTSAIISGASAGEVVVTIPEGYTVKQIGDVLHDKLGNAAIEWERVTGIDSPIAHVVDVTRDKPDSVDLEGYLFPDTYHFAKDATAEEIGLKMIQTLKRRLAENGVNAYMGDSDPYNFHEIMTLASIIEREVMTDVDRAKVSDIFRKRLEIGMALQADSTVNYVTGGKDPSISYDDTELDSPYNTYKYPGLPPGPISNPGIASIIAAAN